MNPSLKTYFTASLYCKTWAGILISLLYISFWASALECRPNAVNQKKHRTEKYCFEPIQLKIILNDKKVHKNGTFYRFIYHFKCHFPYRFYWPSINQQFIIIQNDKGNLSTSAGVWSNGPKSTICGDLTIMTVNLSLCFSQTIQFDLKKVYSSKHWHKCTLLKY